MQTKGTSQISRTGHPANDRNVPFSSNGIRLSGWEWIVIAVLFSALFYFWSALWAPLETFEPGPDYRLPYALGSDYWLYERHCRLACSRQQTLVIGDSVVWGHYVAADNTLSHHLNTIAGRRQFANLGVDGIHPAALAGLLRHYGRDIWGKNVIVHLNPLWMSSKKHDLQTDKEFRFNHPKLVPQFVPNIPCYKDSFSKKVSAVVERDVAFLGWTSHLKIAYFENMDLPAWTMEHPYENPLRAVTLELPASDSDNQQEQASWRQKGIAEQDFQWVELGTSLQWRLFRQTIGLLRARRNTVFVLAGPFNEHMLKPDSRQAYHQMKNEIETWLRRHNVACYVPEALPSELYRDASHPLGEGYAMLAEQLFEDPYFKSRILETAGK